MEMFKLLNMDISKHIVMRAKELGLKQVDLVRLTGASKGTVSNWFKGSSSPSAEFVGPLARALNKSERWVLEGDSTKHQVRDAQSEYQISSMKFELWDDESEFGDDEVALPYYREVELSAGNGSTMVQENHGRKLLFSKSTLKNYNVAPENAACVLVNGNSMDPVIPHGSTAGVDISKKIIKDGKIYAVDNGGLLQVKRLYRLPGGGVKLRSFNQADFEDQDITPDKMKDFNIIGWVFWWSVMNKWD